jgi:hypothetical protein
MIYCKFLFNFFTISKEFREEMKIKASLVIRDNSIINGSK